MAKAGSGRKPDDKKIKKGHPSSCADSTDTAICIEKQLHNEIATSVQRSAFRVENEDASRYAGTAASGTLRPDNNNNNNSIDRTRAFRNGTIATEPASSRGTNRVYGRGKGKNNGVSPFILKNRRDNSLPRQHTTSDVPKNAITRFSRFYASTTSAHSTKCNADEMGMKMHRHGHIQSNASNSTRRPSPSLSPSGRKGSFRVRKPSRGSPATERQRQSKFIEEKMRDKASKVPPPQFLGEDAPSGSPKKGGGGKRRGGALDMGPGHEDEMSSPTKRSWDLRKVVSGLFTRKNAGSDESREPSRTTSPAKQLEVTMEDRKAMTEREYAKLKARGYKGTIKRGQDDVAPVDSSISGSPSKVQPRGLTSSKSLFDLAGIKRGSGASTYHQKLLKKRSNLQEKLAKLDKELEGMEPEDVENGHHDLAGAGAVENSGNGNGSDDDDDDLLPVIPPGLSRMQHAKRGRHPRHVYAPRPLPTIPSRQVLNEIAEEDDEDAPVTAVSHRDIIDKALPPPPCSALKASRARQQNRPNYKVTYNPNRTISQTRKRKGTMTIDEEPEPEPEPEFNEAEYLRAFRTWDNDKDSDYHNQDSPASSDTNADLALFASTRRHLPSRRAKQAKTTTENENHRHRRIPPRRSSRGLRNRYSEDYTVSITPGEAGHEDVPPVPPVPTRLTRRAVRMRKGKACTTWDGKRGEKEYEDPDYDDYLWPDGIF